MGILGLTHDEAGTPVQRLAVTVKVAVALPPDEGKGRKYPVRMDHILFKTRKGDAQTGWDVDAALTEKMVNLYGQNPREIEIVFLDDNIDNIFRTELAWWNATECKCRGSLVRIGENGNARFAMQAVRKTQKRPEGEPWPGNYKYTDGAKKGQPVEPCGDGCPDLEQRRCNPTGDLYFIPFRLPSMGETWHMHTNAYRSIRNIQSSLEQIRKYSGGRLAGIPLRLRVDPESVPYSDADGKRHRGTQHIWRIIFRTEDFQQLLARPKEYLRLYEHGRMQPSKVEIVEDEEGEKARAVGPEFYPAGAAPGETPGEAPGETPPPSLPPKADIPATDEEVRLRHQIHALCEKLDYNRAAENWLLGTHGGKLPELLAELEENWRQREEDRVAAPDLGEKKEKAAHNTDCPGADTLYGARS